MSTTSTISSTYSSHWDRPTQTLITKGWAELLTHSGLKPKYENDPKEEDDLWWKTVLDGEWPMTENDLWRKKTFDRRRPLIEDDLWWKTTLDRRPSLTEDYLSRKMTFHGRRPLTEDNLWRKKTFDRRRSLMENYLCIGCIVYYLKKKFTTPHLDSHSKIDPKPKILSSV